MRVKKPPFFQAQWGDVITNTPYHRPTLEAFTKWWLSFKDIKGLENYDIWFSGSFCEKMFGHYKGIPRDIDIILTGPVEDEEALKYILSHAVHMGFENKILIDISWQSRLHNYNKWEPFCKIRLGKTFTKILGDTVEVHTYEGEEEERLESGLWGFCWSQPPNNWFKGYTRVQNGEYEGLVADLRGLFE